MNMSIKKKEVAAADFSIIPSNTKSSSAINLKVSGNSKGSGKQSDNEILELNVDSVARKMMLEVCKDVATRILDDDETLKNNIDDKETHQSPLNKRCIS